MREISYGLLAIRVGNAWSQQEYDEFVTKQAVDEMKKVEAGQLTQEDTPALGLKSAQTWPRLATDANETSTVGPGHEGEKSGGPLKATELAHQRKKLSRAMLKQHLHIVDEFEHGPHDPRLCLDSHVPSTGQVTCRLRRLARQNHRLRLLLLMAVD